MALKPTLLLFFRFGVQCLLAHLYRHVSEKQELFIELPLDRHRQSVLAIPSQVRQGCVSTGSLAPQLQAVAPNAGLVIAEAAICLGTRCLLIFVCSHLLLVK